jgi:hypothetical protein
MKVYRIVWTAAVGALVIRGLVLGIDRDPALAAATFLLGASAGAAWSLARRRRRRRAASIAVATGAATAGAAGHLPSLGAGLLLIGILVVASAPGLLTTRDRRASISSRSARALDALTRGFGDAAFGYLPLASRSSHLTDEQLWDEWHDAGAALHRPAPPSHLLELADRRRACLDELERRDPERVAAMLNRGSTADWDDAARRLGS